METARPSKKQLDFLSWEMGVFFHFGIRTFYEGHQDWDYAPMPAEGFNPTALDCRQWIRTAQQAGARYAILVAKHHDGFANWPSAYTAYSVEHTPYRDGKGDIVREFTDACREYGLRVGLYYSPAEFAMDKTRRTDREYDDYFIGQIGELLQNYGQIDYLWFDGCGAEGHTFDTHRIIGKIREWQPGILIFNMWDPDTRWIGNEAGLAPASRCSTVSALDFSVLQTEKEALEAPVFLPGECDCRMRERSWFYSDADGDTVKSVEELMGLYYYSVGRGANLLLNIGPDRRGLLPDRDGARLLAFGEEIRRRFSRPLEAQPTVDGTRLRLQLPDRQPVNHLVLGEDLTDGEHIRQFTVRVLPFPYGEPITVYQGECVGHKAICPFPTVSTDTVLVDFVTTGGELSLSAAQLFYVE